MTMLIIIMTAVRKILMMDRHLVIELLLWENGVMNTFHLLIHVIFLMR